ncbi:hypothetical protein Bbelb_052780 [Branchiostoma belcheri]|nr:hypothetical protein Bbelb_052780 [Branchiostoma belcheri]
MRSGLARWKSEAVASGLGLFAWLGKPPRLESQRDLGAGRVKQREYEVATEGTEAIFVRQSHILGRATPRLSYGHNPPYVLLRAVYVQKLCGFTTRACEYEQRACPLCAVPKKHV